MNLSVPRLKTIKRLFTVSGNQNYFPNCSTPLIDKSSETVTGEVCHIKGIKPESPRFDPSKPHCYKCYRVWAEYYNPGYTENYYHQCGKYFQTTLY